jgi:transposase
MYVRTRKNKSGSTSVFVVASKRLKGKKNPRAIVVKSFGSSKDPEQIKSLHAEANKFAAEEKYSAFLRINDDGDIESSKTKVVGFKQVYGKIFDRYFSDMKLGKIDYRLLEELVLMRIAQPVSKLKTTEIASDFDFTDLTINKIYKFMDSLDATVIDKIKNHVFLNSKKLLGKENINVLFYDLTTIYFENNTDSDLKKFGFSKDGKSQHVQISMALIVTDFGLPIGYEIFPGNIYEGKTLLPVLLKLRKDHPVNDVTIVADSGMLSKDNLAKLAEHNFKYIVAARIKNLKSSLKKQVITKENYSNLNEDIVYKTIEVGGVSLIACYSKKRAKKDYYDRQLTLQRLEKFIGKSVKDKLQGTLKKSYVKLSGESKIMIDEQKLMEAAELDGYFGFYTNANIDPKDVVIQYRNLWQVEQTFRITKHNLAIRPVYHYKDRRIEAHFAICFLALALIRTTEYLLQQSNQHISSERLHQLLNQIRVTQITSKKQRFNILSDMPSEMSEIYLALQLSPPKIFLPLPPE